MCIIVKKYLRSIVVPATPLLVSIILCVVGVLLSITAYRHTHGVAVLPQTTVTTDNPTPSEVPLTPDTIRSYRVPPTQPRLLRIPALGVETIVQRVGITPSRAIAAPSNVHVVGWYVQAAIPGQPGVSVIDGHVSGRYAKGVFRDLARLKAHDVVQIEYGNGKTKTFEVMTVQTMSPEQAAVAMLRKRADIPSQLNLITCGGSFDRAAGQYTARTVVETRLQTSVSR